jgi:hypothetical protein
VRRRGSHVFWIIDQQMMVRLSVTRTGQTLFQSNIPGTHFFYRLSKPQDHSTAGRITSIEESNDLIGNRTRDLLVCSKMPQSATLPPVPNNLVNPNESYQRKGKRGNYVAADGAVLCFND